MTKTLSQSVTFKNCSPKQLYRIYMDSKKHAQAIGSKASVQNKVGGSFSAFGMLKGKFLVLVKNKMIVQAWRSVKFRKGDDDSILVLRFEKVKGGARIDLLHTAIPEHDYADIKKGWPNYYWKPWQKYLSKQCCPGCC